MQDPTGEQVNALAQHIRNLLTPSTPFFFNTLYDPYAEGTDFVRGYPFSLREGVPTAVSHGGLFHKSGPTSTSTLLVAINPSGSSCNRL